MHGGQESSLNRLLSLFLLFALICALIIGMGSNLSSKFIDIGNEIWPSYAEKLRSNDMVAPECDIAELEIKSQQCKEPEKGQQIEATDADPFGGTDPFASPKPAKPADPFDGKDPFATPKPTSDDPFAGNDPFASPQTTNPVVKTTVVSCVAQKKLFERCQIRHQRYNAVQQELTPSVERFRSLDKWLGGLAKFPYKVHLLILVVLLGVVCTTWSKVHIALRNPTSYQEEFISQSTQLLAHLIWMFSCFMKYKLQLRVIEAGEGGDDASQTKLALLLWVIGFGVLAALNFYHLLRNKLSRQNMNLARLLMVVPLYVYMVIISGVYFFIVHAMSGKPYFEGPAAYLTSFSGPKSINIYLGIALYIWAGMLFASTRIAQLSFNILLPWGLPIGILAWLTVTLSAIPTAYSGASGIFVIAAGAVIFDRMVSAGATRRLALSTTAMSGSLGVVLRPCLVVVLISMLNGQATSTDLFSKGFWVFALTAYLLLLAMLLRYHSRHGRILLRFTWFAAVVGLAIGPWISPDAFAPRVMNSVADIGKLAWCLLVLVLGGCLYVGIGTIVFKKLTPHLVEAPIQIKPISQALPQSVGGLIPLLPYFVLAIVGYLIYGYGFKTWLDPESAPLILPGILLGIVFFERLVLRPKLPEESDQDRLWTTLVKSTTESSIHIGALLILMAASVGFAGVIENAEIMEAFPADFGGPVVAMLALSGIMVIIGMIMDAMGAVIVVSVTLAQVAAANGIDPIHFWMMVLVAFELGYLTPPVAINHLLARQVIGEDSHVENDGTENFWARNEHIWLPMAVMSLALLIVGFVPFLFY